MKTAGVVLRLIALAEFSGALTAWVLGVLDWGLTLTLTVPTLIVALGGLEGDEAQGGRAGDTRAADGFDSRRPPSAPSDP